MTVRIRPATRNDLHPICRLRIQRTAWLIARGSDQWTVTGRGLPIDMFAQLVGHAIDAGETWIAELDDNAPAGTITVNDRADPGLWTPDEMADALIVHYMIVDLRFAGRGVGRELLRHATTLTRRRGRDWVRLDAWTTNYALHSYYLRSGFRMVRIAGPDCTGPSRALFERHVDSRLPARSAPCSAPIPRNRDLHNFSVGDDHRAMGPKGQSGGR
ncbi:GNAT family N-acetyltransferase [Nocardia paucivorans]|uniref:GNAT family N-acetyltransferase n=1 Tax=Nocardia paucivorans TaxID=114259 RepID=UPI0002DFD66A|nr:GNAT family N-acetyltransferase [Nocardia paucivorans]